MDIFNILALPNNGQSLLSQNILYLKVLLIYISYTDSKTMTQLKKFCFTEKAKSYFKIPLIKVGIFKKGIILSRLYPFNLTSVPRANTILSNFPI